MVVVRIIGGRKVFSDDIKPEEEEKLIQKVANIIFERDMTNIASLILEGMMPLVYIGGQFARVTLAPLLPILGIDADRFILVFEKRENIKKLQVLIEEKERKEKERSLDKNEGLRKKVWSSLRARIYMHIKNNNLMGGFRTG